jgi:pimeloyl-ACP methyl ester carboxylesterase
VTNKLIVIAFRGTENLTNYLADLYIPMTDVDLCRGCRAHRGFWLAWLDAKSAVLAGFKAARKAHPRYKVVVAGHSFGGAIATIAATELRIRGYNADLVCQKAVTFLIC